MVFFDKWQKDFTNQSVDRLKINDKKTSDFISLKNPNEQDFDYPTRNYDRQVTPLNSPETGTNVWQCECSAVNSVNLVNCTICFRKSPYTFYEKPEIHGNGYSNINPDIPQENTHASNELLEVHEFPATIWTCEFCTTRNSLHKFNCTTCFTTIPNIERDDYRFLECNVTGDGRGDIANGNAIQPVIQQPEPLAPNKTADIGKSEISDNSPSPSSDSTIIDIGGNNEIEPKKRPLSICKCFSHIFRIFFH